MAEKLEQYYQIYNNVAECYSEPMTKQQLIIKFETSLLFLPENNSIVFDISQIYLTKHEFETKSYTLHDN